MKAPDASLSARGTSRFRSLPRRAVLQAIRLYQRFVSPHKGFGCAYRHHTGRASCSMLGYRAVRRFGVATGVALIRQRTHLCGVAHRRHRPQQRAAGWSAQRGVCDIGCDLPGDGCDLPSGRCLAGAGEWLSCCDCAGCDWPSRRNQDKKNERPRHIPPRRASNGRPQNKPS